METDAACVTFCSLEYYTGDKVQKLSDFECYTPSSEPFRSELGQINCHKWLISRNMAWLGSQVSGIRDAVHVRVYSYCAVALIRVQAACGFCGGQSGTGAGFLRVLQFPPPIIPPISPLS
jgi:hypothetical protein